MQAHAPNVRTGCKREAEKVIFFFLVALRASVYTSRFGPANPPVLKAIVLHVFGQKS